MNTKKALAEFFGTFWLVLGGCGSAVFASAFPGVGIDLLGVALSIWFNCTHNGIRNWTYFRMSFESCCYSWLWAGGRIKANEVLPYIISQVFGAIAAAVFFILL